MVCLNDSLCAVFVWKIPIFIFFFYSAYYQQKNIYNYAKLVPLNILYANEDFQHDVLLQKSILFVDTWNGSRPPPTNLLDSEILSTT